MNRALEPLSDIAVAGAPFDLPCRFVSGLTAERREPAVLPVDLLGGDVPVDVAGDPDAGVAQYSRNNLKLRT